jgi:hypothetical protein
LALAAIALKDPKAMMKVAGKVGDKKDAKAPFHKPDKAPLPSQTELESWLQEALEADVVRRKYETSVQKGWRVAAGMKASVVANGGAPCTMPGSASPSTPSFFNDNDTTTATASASASVSTPAMSSASLATTNLTPTEQAGVVVLDERSSQR